ncbi:MAG: ATP-binding protein, partial [Thermoplasmata archaeon]
LNHLVDLFARDGLGTFEVVRFDETTMLMELSCPDSLEALGYLSHGEEQESPTCSFICGILAGVGKHVFGIADCEGPNEIVATETCCVSTGETACRFLVGRRGELESLGHTVSFVRESVSEHALRFNDEILTRNLDLQNLNLDLERQVRRRMEELKRSDDKYKSLVNLSPDPIIVCMGDGTIRSLNEAALGMLGYGPEDVLVSKNISTLLLDGANAWDRCVWLVNKEGVLKNQEFEFVKKGGEKVVGEVSARISDIHPERCVHIIVRDVTERNLLSARMEESRLESEFLNDLLSHDIMNYMTAAMHFLDRVNHSKGLDEEQAKALAVVAKDVKGACELASVVRDLSKADAIAEGECRSVTDVCGMIEEAVEDAKRMYSDRRVIINFERPASTCYVEGSALLSRMFVNILTNAIKFDPSKETVIDIEIGPVSEGGTDYWSVRISDHGKGIPDNEKEKVFERYFRGDAGVSGAGLGLHVARKIAGACGGRIWAEDRVQGDFTKGTVMVALLRKAANGQNNHKH